MAPSIEVVFTPKQGSKHLRKFVPAEEQYAPDTMFGFLQSVLAKQTKLPKDRIRLSVRGEYPSSSTSKSKDRVMQPNDLVAGFAVDGKVEVYYRDLGPQIAWRTVFLLEYLGPILIHPIFYFGRKQIYDSSLAPTIRQTAMFVCVMLHFLKREYETAFVHKFSLATMPLFNLFKNCSHYWLLSGVLVAYFGYAPQSWWTGSASKLDKFLFYSGGICGCSKAVKILTGAWLFAELSNFIVHLNLASLRPEGSTQRHIPYGYGFHLLSCPNYFFEAMGWTLLSVLSGNWAMAVFGFVGALQMYFWALKKHKRYLNEFPDYPKNRKAMIPFIA